MTLKLNGTNSEAAPAYAGDDADTGLQCGTNELKLVTGGTARATVDDAGRVLVGTTTNRTMAGHASALQVSGTDFSSSTINITNNANSGNGAYLFFSKQRSGSAGGNTVLQNNDLVGQIRWLGADGTDLETSLGQISMHVDGTPGSNDMPGRIVFATTADGANSPTERLKITSDGTLKLLNSPGIDFSQIQTNASTMTSETLDSYEEGTWTPEILGISTNGTWAAASNNGGFYVKIGKQVTAWFNAVGTLSGATGHTMRLHGLPLTTSSNHSPSGAGNSIYSSGSIQYWSGAARQVIGPLTEPNTTVAYFHTYGTNSSSGAQVPVNNTNHNLHGFVTYFTA